MAAEIPEYFVDLISAVVKTAMDDGMALISDSPNKPAQRETMAAAMAARVDLHAAISKILNEKKISQMPAGAPSVLTDGLGDTLRAMGDSARRAYIQQRRRDASAGFEHKVKTGMLTADDLAAFMHAEEDLGRSKAMDEAALMTDDLQAKIDALMLEYCPHEMTTEQYERWENHQRVVSPDTVTPNDYPADSGPG